MPATPARRNATVPLASTQSAMRFASRVASFRFSRKNFSSSVGRVTGLPFARLAAFDGTGDVSFSSGAVDTRARSTADAAKGTQPIDLTKPSHTGFDKPVAGNYRP